MEFSGWVCSGITAVSAAVSFAYSLAALRAAKPELKTSSRYAASRSAALLLAALAALFTGSTGFVAAVATAMVVVQAFDALIGASISDRLKTYGPAIAALFNFAALVWMLAA